MKIPKAPAIFAGAVLASIALFLFLRPESNDPGSVRPRHSKATTIKDSDIGRLIEDLNSEDRTIARNARVKLIQNGHVAVKALLERLQDTLLEGEERIEIVDALGLLKSKDATLALLKELDTASSCLRKHVYVALGRIQDATALPALLKGLEEKDPTLRLAVIEGLSEMKSPDALAHLVDQFTKDQGPEGYGRELKIAAARALGSIGDKGAVEPLTKQLAGTVDLGYHLVVIDALVEIGDVSAVDSIQKYLNMWKGKEPADGRLRSPWQAAVKNIQEKLLVLQGKNKQG